MTTAQINEVHAFWSELWDETFALASHHGLTDNEAAKLAGVIADRGRERFIEAVEGEICNR